MAKHGLEDVSVVWLFMLIFTTCPICASKWLRRCDFSPFLRMLDFKLEKENLEHGKTWFGRVLCCLVIHANRHRLPCMCVNLAPMCICFKFLLC